MVAQPLVRQLLTDPQSPKVSWSFNTIEHFGRNTASITGTECVSQQIAFIDSFYFMWYTQHIILPVLKYHAILSTNMGVDRFFCIGSQFFVRYAFHVHNSTAGCVILSNTSNPVLHMDFRSLAFHQGRPSKSENSTNLAKINGYHEKHLQSDLPLLFKPILLSKFSRAQEFW